MSVREIEEFLEQREMEIKDLRLGSGARPARLRCRLLGLPGAA